MVDDELRDMEDDMAPPPKKGKLPMIIIGVVIAAVVGGGGYFLGTMKSGGDEKDKTVQTDNKNQAKPADTKTPDQNTGDGDTASNNEDNAEDGKDSPKDGKKPKPKGSRGVLRLDTFTVNLNDPFGRRYVECTLNLVISDKALVPKIKENELLLPKIRHEIFMTISAKSYNELKSTSGKVTLFEEIMMRVNEILKQEMDVEPVVEVLQTKFLMQ